MEPLEGRQLLSASVSFSAGTLSVVGDASSQRLQIVDAHTGTQTSTSIAIDTNRNGSFTDAVDLRRTYSGVTRFNLDLRGGNDAVNVLLAEPYTSVSKTFYVRGGDGNDRFSFASSVSQGLRSANLAFDIDMGGGADQVSLQLDDVAGSTVSGRVLGGSGDDRVMVSSDFDVRNSSVNLSVNLGDGNDSYQESHDLEEFDLLGSSSLWRTLVHGGAGNDSITSDSFGSGQSALIEGTFSNEFYGDGGQDHLNVDTTALALNGGTLRVLASGGAGADDIWIAATIGTSSTGGVIDIAGRGNADSDRLQLMLDADNTRNSYAVPGGAVLDGGDGADVGSASGTGLAQLASIEAAQ